MSDTENSNTRLDKLETKMEETKLKINDLETKTSTCRLSCELPAYKKEMKERCERLDSNIKANNETCKIEKQNVLDKIRDLSEEFEYKFKQSRTLIGRVISTGVVFGVALMGVLGTIQINKVSQSEFNHFINIYQAEKKEQNNKFDRFIDTYTFDRNKRDAKIDAMFQKQIDFNQEIVKQNGILQRQLEVLKTQVNMK